MYIELFNITTAIGHWLADMQKFLNFAQSKCESLKFDIPPKF